MDVHTARTEHDVSIETKHLSQVLPVLKNSQIHSGLRIPATKLDGQMGNTPGLYFGGMGFKPCQADILSQIRRIRQLRPVWLFSFHAGSITHRKRR